jgi:hypothetical protein
LKATTSLLTRSAARPKRFPIGKAPSTLKGVLEARLVVEAATLPLFLPMLSLAPRGDGHPVLLVPPFIAGDKIMGVLKAYLKNRGHQVETW